MADARPRLVTALASALKVARESKGWTQRQLAAEVTSAGHELSSAYVGLIEAGHRIPTEAVVRALADVLERDADELIKLRSQAELDKIMRGLQSRRLSDFGSGTLAEGRKWVQDFLALHGDKQITSASVAADGASAWLSGSGGPRRGRRYELATRLFELVADLGADEIQRVIGYTEAVREDRRPPAAESPQ